MAWIGRVLFLCLAPLLGWNRVAPGKDQQVKASHRVPVGRVEIIDRAHNRSGSSTVDIRSYEALYGTLGVGGEQFSVWEARYGMDSLGVGSDGSQFIPGFPVLSKVAWMYVDPVDLSDSETRDLVIECGRAMAGTQDESALTLFGEIRDLAIKAIQQSETLRFGHP